jgi:pilus assembly protein CpaB
MRGIIMLGAALLLAVIAVVIARAFLQERDRPVVELEATPLTTVVVARTRLDFGNKLEPAHLTEIKWPAENVPPGTYRSVDEILKPGEQRVVLRSIELGEPIFATKITGAGQRGTLSSIISSEKRAMTIRVNDVVGVAGFVLPGDRVDVLLTRAAGDSFVTDIILQNIHVLGVDQLASDRADQPVVAKAVTVEVDPTEAQKLTLAAQVGSLSLSLRAEADTNPVSARTVNLADLQGGMPVEPKLEKPVVRRVVPGLGAQADVKIYRQLESSNYKVPREAAADILPEPPGETSEDLGIEGPELDRGAALNPNERRSAGA